MKTQQTKITAASITVTKMMTADSYASWVRIPKEDDRPRASRRTKGNPTKHATSAGRRITEEETAGVKGTKTKANAKVNRRAMEDTPRWTPPRQQRQRAWIHRWRPPLQQRLQERKQVRERVRFTIVCTSTAARVSEPRKKETEWICKELRRNWWAQLILSQHE